MAKKKQVAKQKKREREVARKKHLTKLARQAERKQERAEALMEQRINKIVRKMGEYGQHVNPADVKEKSEETINQLERNIQILAALEDEHRKEQEQREKINEELEAEGHFTLEEKMAAARRRTLLEQTMNTPRDEYLDIVVCPPRPREVADVSVIKATPVAETPVSEVDSEA